MNLVRMCVARWPVLQQVLDQPGQFVAVVTGFHQLAQRQRLSWIGVSSAEKMMTGGGGTLDAS